MNWAGREGQQGRGDASSPRPCCPCGLSTSPSPFLPGLDRINLSDFDPPIVFEMRAAFRYFDGFVVIARVDYEITAHNFFGFGVWAVNHARLAVAHRDVASAFFFELVASDEFAFGFNLAPPGDVFADDLLRFLGREVREIGWRFAQ